MEKQNIWLSEERNAYLTCYIQNVDGRFGFSKRAAIVIIPGGAYAYCSEREADPVAFAYMKAGYHAFVLNYTCKDKGGWPRPLEDYEKTMRIIEENSENWGLDTSKVVTIGFSAGGHLAACSATIAKRKPAATILVYPALDRDILDLLQPLLPEPAKLVNSDTCPCFLVAARDDSTVDIKNLLHFEQALQEYCIPFESHIYSYGGHGFSICNELIEKKAATTRLPRWIDESVGWLEEVLGKLTVEGFSKPNPKVEKNGDDKEYLSVECSLRHLLKQNKDTLEIINPVLDEVLENLNKSKVIEAMQSNSLRYFLTQKGCSNDKIASIDLTLRKIRNLK